jgi:hypothetical protein
MRFSGFRLVTLQVAGLRAYGGGCCHRGILMHIGTTAA